MQWMTFPAYNAIPTIKITSSNWCNPTMNYKEFMVPGILVTLLTMIGTFLASLNIVLEKEIGTIDQINVSPISKSTFILGKLIPFWMMGLVTLTIGLLVARLFYDIVPVGNIALIYLFRHGFSTGLVGCWFIDIYLCRNTNPGYFCRLFCDDGIYVARWFIYFNR